MQLSHFALNRNELLLNMAQKDHRNKSKYITKPTKQKQSKTARSKPLAVPQIQAQSRKAFSSERAQQFPRSFFVNMAPSLS